MKITLSTNVFEQKNKQKANFGAYRAAINNNGEREHHFYMAYDPDKYNAEIQFFNAKKENQIWKVNSDNPIDTITLPEDGLKISMDDLCLKYPDAENLAYKYVLTNKSNPHDKKYIVDNGTKAYREHQDEIPSANVLYTDRTIISRPQNAILIMPDMFHYVPSKRELLAFDPPQSGIPRNSVRNHVNLLGGNLLGLIEKIPELRKAGYTKIVGTPFTKDDVSSHKYWTQNAYRLAKSLGTDKDFVKLQETLVENGISWIADGAFVNEGLQGVHFKSVLKWGQQSPFRDWFYLTNEPTEVLKIGIFPEFNKENVNFKIVNSKYILSQDKDTKKITVRKNREWDRTKPTYLQFFDKTLVSDTESTSDTLIKKYSKLDIDSSMHITTHDASVNPYYFEINPNELIVNIKRLNSKIKKDLGNPKWDLQNIDTMKEIFQFSKFSFGDKAMGGFVCWDGNVDIPKLNLHVSQSDLQKHIGEEEYRYIGHYQVKDYIVNAGRYWTKTARNIQIQHVAKMLGQNPDYGTLKELVNKGKLPKDILKIVNEEVVNNIRNHDYETNDAQRMTKKELILKEIEQVPLDALGCSDELMAVISSPYISKRPFSKSDVKLTRSEIAKNGYQNIPEQYREAYAEFDGILRKELLEYITNILDDINSNSYKDLYDPLKENPLVTQKGAEIIKLVVPQLTKGVLELALHSNVEDRYNTAIDDITLQTFGINEPSPEEEAKKVVQLFKKGMRNLKNEPVTYLYNTSKDFVKPVGELATKTDITSLRLAKVIVDRGETGLGWRIDAAKDVSNIDDLKCDKERFDKTWDNVISVWKDFAQAVREENPNAYLTAEVTDLDQFMKNKQLLSGQKYKTEYQAELAFLEETGITSFANYKYFYSDLKDLFHQNSETGDGGKIGQISGFRDGKFISAWEGNKPFLDMGPYDAILGSYNFYENHDKPRILHTSALNMELFHGDFDENRNLRAVANKVLAPIKPNLREDEYHRLNPKAIAMADRLGISIDNCANDSKNQFIDENLKVTFKHAVAQIAYGEYKDTKINPVLFGVRPFDIVIEQVIEQMKYNGYHFADGVDKQLRKALLSEILKPSCDDAYKLYKFMGTLPGMLTDFAGHRQGATGYESLKNNLYQQNRNRINWEWVRENTRDEGLRVVKDFESKMNEVIKLRKNPDLSALTTGDTVVLPKQESDDTMALFRYNDLGSKVITVYQTAKIGNTVDKNITIEKILLNSNSNGETAPGIQGGLKKDTVFYNAGDETDKCVYKVCEDDGGQQYIEKLYNGNHAHIEIRAHDEGDRKSDGNVLILAQRLGNKRLNPTSFRGLQAFHTYHNSLYKSKQNLSKKSFINTIS